MMSRVRAPANAVKHEEFHGSIPFEFNGFFEEKELFDMLYAMLVKYAQGLEFESFKIAVSWPELDESSKMHLKYSLQQGLITKFAEELKKTINFSCPEVIFLIDFNRKSIFLRLEAAYVVGRYCKYSRKIAQTEYFCNRCRGKGCWYCKGTGHFSDESVEQLLASVITPAYEGRGAILHGAGREDLDVLMLGTGRPFIMQIVAPKKRNVNFAELEKEINTKLAGKVSVNSLATAKVDDVSPLKDNPHDKVYSAIVSISLKTPSTPTTQPQSQKEPLDTSKIPLNEKLKVVQTTPDRVAKRRAILQREKEVTILSVTPVESIQDELGIEIQHTSDEFALVEVKLLCSHGTYVKEFISSDDGRTIPSIASLVGKPCTCIRLDVLEIR